MQIKRIGLDLAKYVFEVHAVGTTEEVVLRKTLRRDAVAQFFAELPPCIVGMEACCGSHYWARVLTDLGHEVRLISPQFVKPYVKSNKNDRNDAEAICEAAGRPSMRFVPPKSAEQLEIQAVHRIRQRVVANRTRLVNQVRGLLGEHGVVVARDITRIRRALSEIVDNNQGEFGEIFIDVLRDMREELAERDSRLAGCNRRIKNLFRANEMCQRIGQIEGVGPITTTALVAAVGDKSCFKNGRQFAAWLGLVPKQRSSGGKARLFGISKRGDRYLRTLLIHGARVVLGKAAGKTDPRSQWIARMRERRHPNVVSVALANKNARIVWSLLARDQNYRPEAAVSLA
ncbi:IS110 family transposase [Leisingera sp. MMG026]|uniref:IS110 family transposase n=1 Tax=Leisingera sp. MMG026 TaxID=2909982 RepID=UPI001EFFFA0C|nr:IS110 family transposase [Leisingera sp. MMG026]MCF6432113.1 IS110 family transposase [Leisingera sp. MMG026]